MVIATLYALIPMGVAILGGLIASLYVPKPKMVGALQHFVAGIVIGAVAIELVPKILGQESSWTVGIGFLLGVIAMILLHELAHFLIDHQGKESLPYGLIAASGIDLFIDGILIGVAFLAGSPSGIVIAASLSLCALFLNMAVATSLRKRQVGRGLKLTIITAIAITIPLGALVGSTVIALFPPIILVETLAFGVAALLYLGVEELLAEAHETKDTAWVSGAFFLGFLVILLIRA
ncbi:MAG: ZIP family metal transporter [Parachlamydiales bacterium]